LREPIHRKGAGGILGIRRRYRRTTGAEDLCTPVPAATELRERNARCGAVGVCIGSGQAVAVVLENPQAG
jgi:hypothetical protein